MSTTFTITGLLTDADNNLLSGFTVEAWDKELIFKHKVGSDVTKADGSFSIAFNKPLMDFLLNKKPQVFFKVYKDQQLVYDGKNIQTWEIKPGTESIYVNITLIPLSKIVYSVYGTVYDELLQPLKNAPIKAFDKDMRVEQLLGETTTDAAGNYSIKYARDKFANADRDLADLFIRVNMPDGSSQDTDTYFNAAIDLKLDISFANRIYTGPSEFQLVVTTITPLIGTVAIDQLTENAIVKDISFLTKKTNLSVSKLLLLVIAHRFEKWTAVSAQVYYGILNYNLPGNVDVHVLPDDMDTITNTIYSAFWNININSMMSAFQKSIDNNIVDYNLSAQLNNIQVKLQQLITSPLQNPSNSIQFSSIYDKMALASLTKEQQQAFFNEYTISGLSSNLWASLKENPLFSAIGLLDKLQAIFQLALLIGDDISLLKTIITSKNIADLDNVQALASLLITDWETLIMSSRSKKVKLPYTDDVQAQAAILITRFKNAYPNVALTSSIISDKANSIPGFTDLVTFLSAPSTVAFDFTNTHINKYLKTTTLPEGINDRALLVENIMKIQRLHKIAPSYDMVSVLLNDNIHTARQIYVMGKSNFTNKYKDKLGGQISVEDIFEKATVQHASALHIAADLHSKITGSALKVMPDYATQFQNSTLVETYPDLKNLFGLSDYCECSDCSSFTSSSAYLTDILNYLQQRKSNTKVLNPDGTSSLKSVKSVLLSRRQDIGDIDLNCNNANVQIPYIDLVNELLEDNILPPIASITIDSSGQLTSGVIQTDLLKKLQGINPSYICNISLLTANAVVSEVFKTEELPDLNQWIVRDTFITLKIVSESLTGGIAAVMETHNTHLSQDEIAANPEYINTNVYEAIRNPINNPLLVKQIPFGLPFDLYFEETNNFIEQLGIKRSQLIDTYKKINNSDTTDLYSGTDYAVACAYLGISSVGERDIIFIPNTNQQIFWGKNAIGPNIVVQTPQIQVSAFLNITGLSFNQLQTLASLSFIHISVSNDSSCDTDVMTVGSTLPLGEFNQSLDEVNRFLRLWKKVNQLPQAMSMEELDACIMSTSLGKGILNDAFAVQLYQLLRLVEKTKLTVMQVLSFYQNIDTDGDNSLYNKLFQNKTITNPLNAKLAYHNDGTVSGLLTDTDVKPLLLSICSITNTDFDFLINEMSLLSTANSSSPTLSQPEITLANLSYLYRCGLLSKILSISVTDLFTFITLTGINPILNIGSSSSSTGPDKTLLFIDNYKTIQAARFSIDDINYVLTNQSDAGPSLIPDTAIVAAGLNNIRTTLKRTSDPNSTLLANWLADSQLNWDTAIVAKLIDIIATNDDASYQSKISSNINFLSALRIKYQASFCTTLLSQWPTDSSSPTTPIIIPEEYSVLLSYDDRKKILRFAGFMTSDIQTDLLKLSNDTDYQSAIKQLYTISQQTDNLTTNQFSNIISLLKYTSIADRYVYFLNAILPIYIQLKQDTSLEAKISTSFYDTLNAQIATIFKISPAIAAQLIDIIPPIDIIPSVKKIREYLAEGSFINSGQDIYTKSASGNILQVNFPSQVRVFHIINRLVFLINKFNIPASDVSWLLGFGQQIGLLNLNILPSTGQICSFASWEVLNNLYFFKRKYKPVSIPDSINPDKTVTLSVFNVISDVLKLTATPSDSVLKETILNNLVTLTQWNKSDLDVFLNIDVVSNNPLGLPIDATSGSVLSLADINILLRLQNCFAMAKQLNITAARCIQWIKEPCSFEWAADIKQIVNSNYTDPTQWLTVVKPIQNGLRQKRRDALVAFMLSNAARGVGAQTPFADIYALYSYFYLDTQMSPCQLTTRTIQAYCSVQLFVQRCRMGLETEVIVNTEDQSSDSEKATYDSDWLQWGWMGLYEKWVQARTVFLYPENYIQPELLPNHSYLFEDAQNDLTQNEVTVNLAETTITNYLEKLDDIARLEIKGMWYDDDTDILHVFGRTYGGDPATYYYRKKNSKDQWSPWEKVPLDISGDHLVPVVHNGRIYLFWPVFTKKTNNKQQSTQGFALGSDNSVPSVPLQPPSQYWQIQMAFSEYKNGKWSAKKISSSDESQSVISSLDLNDKSNFTFVSIEQDFINAYNKGQNQDPPIKTTDDIIENLKNFQSTNGITIVCLYNTYKFVGGQASSKLSIITNSSFNAFQLDSGHGYPVATKILGDFNNFGVPYFNESKLVNMLEYGTSSLTISSMSTGTTNSTGWTNPILSVDPMLKFGSNNSSEATGSDGSTDYILNGNIVADSITFRNLISLQMSFADKYKYIYNNSTLNQQTSTTSTRNNNLSKILQARPISDPPPEIPVGDNGGTTHKGGTVNGPSDNPSGPKFTFGTFLPFVYQDSKKTFFVEQEFITKGQQEHFYRELKNDFLNNVYLADYLKTYLPSSLPLGGPNYHFYSFYHPFADYFIRILTKGGTVNDLFNRKTQLYGDIDVGGESNKFVFDEIYKPSLTVYAPGYPKEIVDFNLHSSYGAYNWELFFHSILMVAMRLSQNQQFEEADRWFKYIFNPSDTSSQPSPQKYWVTKPFFTNTTNDDTTGIDQLILQLEQGTNSSFQDAVNAWRNNPYDPHIIAQSRITAYMKTTVMKYLDNLIAWGDLNFSQHTMESVNLAIQYYIQAQEIIGIKSQPISSVNERTIYNYYQLETSLNGMGAGLSDPLVQIENLVSPQTTMADLTLHLPNPPIFPQQLLYFCIPPNQQLLNYQDVVNDRLNKIRNCLNIKGQFDPLSPFPPDASLKNSDGNDPNNFDSTLPNYRFNTLLQKATELCNEVKSLGGSLLSALEKQDAETLSLLRSGQEIQLLNAVMLVKQKQLEDSQASLANLRSYQMLVQTKIDYYQNLISKGYSDLEAAALGMNIASSLLDIPYTLAKALSGGTALIPQVSVGISGFGGTPQATVDFGGNQVSDSQSKFAEAIAATASGLSKIASISSTIAGYQRRADEWQNQLNLATIEMEQVQNQLTGAQIKIDIANQEIANQQLQINNAQAVNDYMVGKYTNQQLYSWMVTQLSNVYFQSYQLAYQMAKKAEQCFRYELGLVTSSYINYGYWNSLKKGLLSGEQLMYNIKQMEMSYLELNNREYELTKHISIAQLDPLALLQLKENNKCFINLPEELFDMDYSGHYFRRIKSVSVTIPCVAGPYTTISCKMSLTNNSIRIDNSGTDNYKRQANDPRFRDNIGTEQSIAVSHAQNDSGLFELNFHDERYLPFEGAGAISTWCVELPELQQFDYNTISDVIIQLKYTAREGGDALKTSASNNLQTAINAMLVSPNESGLILSFSVKRDFPTEWYNFLNLLAGQNSQTLKLSDLGNRLPYFTKGKNITTKISEIQLFIDNGDNVFQSNITISPEIQSSNPIGFSSISEFGNLKFSEKLKFKSTLSGDCVITNTISNPNNTNTPPLLPNDIIIVFYYTLESI